MQPIPSQILKDTVTIRTTTGVDVWNNPTYTEQTQKKVHLQGGNKVFRTKDNSEVLCNSTLFVDRYRSTPFVDWLQLYEASEAAGLEMSCVINGYSFRVVKVDDVPDPFGKLHHYEVGLV